SVVGMLAAETPSVDGHLAASTPRKGGNAVSVTRLPFKRLNTEPKENQPPKRPCAHACPQPVDSDGHNENESTPLSERSGPPLVNGRGPIDGFFSRRHPPPSDEKMIIDLTVDKSSSPVKGFPSPASACRPAKSKLCSKDKPAFSGQPPNVEETLKPCSSDSVIISDDESLQEHEEKLRLRQEKERQKEEAKAEKQKKKEEARKLKEEREKEKRERKEKDEREKLMSCLKKCCVSMFLFICRINKNQCLVSLHLQTLAAACGKFAPFEIKENMALAPLTRVQCKDSVLEELDHCLLNPAEKANALKDWIGKKPRQSGATKPRRTDSLSDCIVAEGAKPDGVPDRKRYGPMKLLQFHENYRPAYWGTWSKKTSSISPRCPFKQDKVNYRYIIYSVISFHLLQEDEEEGGEDDDDDDGFFVPHGYLSEDEGALEEEEGGDLEKQKLRQKLKAREWDELMSSKKKMKVLEPVVRGCVWEGDGDGLEIFQCYAVCLFEPLPKTDTSPSPEELSQRVQREDHLLGQLLPLLHGNVNSSKVIITEFQEFYRQSSSASSPDSVTPQSQTDNIPTRIQLKRLIRSNAVYEKRSNFRRCCWYVHAEVLSRYGQEALPVPCHWTYLTTGAREECREENLPPANPQGNPPTTPSMPSSSSKRKSTGSLSITKFMKRRSEPRQTEATEADGFQADTEDDEDDCIIVSTQSGHETDNPMEVTPSDSSALPENNI
uniref:Chromatin assembly factor 1, subunit A (p150) n=1 Tax=Oryzias latipes TaxID=8090 RepID=A0A3P9LHF6_ORYLA